MAVPSITEPEKVSLALKPRWRFSYSIGTLLCAVTAFCLYQGYRTNQQILKYYTPAPAVDYHPEALTYKFTDEDFVGPLDSRPATISLRERVDFIASSIAELRKRGELDRAMEIQSGLDTALRNREGPYPMDGTAQLHAIGVYRGGSPVKITYTGAPLVLVLCAYDSTTWRIEADPGVQLQRVIVSGYHRQFVQGVPDDVDVEIRCYDNQDQDWFCADTPLEAHSLNPQLKKITGLEALTFQTAYEPKGRALIIGPGNAEWTASMTLKSIEPLYLQAVRSERTELAQKLARHHFPDVTFSASSRPAHGLINGNFGTHSVFGPYARTMRPLQQATAQFAVDPRGPSFFSFVSNQGIVTLDPKTGTSTPWPIAGLEISPHREACLAYDTNRQRLLVWGNDLAAVDILKKEATLVRKGNPGICAIAYSERDELLYACCATRDPNTSETSMREVRTFNEFGAELSRTPIEVPIPGQNWPYPAGTLKLRVLENVLLITNLGGYDGNHYLVPSDINYIVDPKTGNLLFACKRKPR